MHRFTASVSAAHDRVVNTIGSISIAASCRQALVLTPACPMSQFLVTRLLGRCYLSCPGHPFPSRLGESPLTDPRSLGSSALFHVLLVLLASLTALNVALPMAASRPKALYAEIDPVDNRADVPSSPGQGGGGPGDIGGMSNLPFIPPSDGTQACRGDPRPGRRHAPGRDLAQLPAQAERVAPACLTRPSDDRSGTDSRLGFRRRRGCGWWLRRRCRPRHRTRHPVLRRTRSCPFLRLRHRLLRQHGHAQLTRGRQT